jgi:hypothetical protein
MFFHWIQIDISEVSSWDIYKYPVLFLYDRENVIINFVSFSTSVRISAFVEKCTQLLQRI